MNLDRLAAALELTPAASPPETEQQVNGGCVSDLLSEVMGHAAPSSIWVTVQTHPNIVAVAVLADLAGIIITGGLQPEPQTIEKAKTEGVAVFTTAKSSFTVVGELYQLGVLGPQRQSDDG